MQLETLNSQLEEQTEALTAIEHTAAEAEQSFAGLQSQQRQAQQQFEQVKAQVENNSSKMQMSAQIEQLGKMYSALNSKRNAATSSKPDPIASTRR